eukprot:5456591-Prymnesium_polylepis.1
MPTNASVLASLDYGRGEYVQFHLYEKTTVSTRTIDLMRALLDAGARTPFTSGLAPVRQGAL